MDTFELKKEQLKLAAKISLIDNFGNINKVAGISSLVTGDKILACVILCQYPSFKVLEKQTYLLTNPLPYQPGFSAYREMPAMIEAYNLLEDEPDLILVKGTGINHPRKIGLASHLGLALNKPTIGVSEKSTFGLIEKGKVILNNEIVGFEVRTREFSNPIYISPGHQITLGSTLDLITKMVQYPHKLPEPVHLAQKIGKKVVKKNKE